MTENVETHIVKGAVNQSDTFLTENPLVFMDDVRKRRSVVTMVTHLVFSAGVSSTVNQNMTANTAPTTAVQSKSHKTYIYPVVPAPVSGEYTYPVVPAPVSGEYFTQRLIGCDWFLIGRRTNRNNERHGKTGSFFTEFFPSTQCISVES